MHKTLNIFFVKLHHLNREGFLAEDVNFYFFKKKINKIRGWYLRTLLKEILNYGGEKPYTSDQHQTN